METRLRRLRPLVLMSGALALAVACSASASPSPSLTATASPSAPRATDAPASQAVATPSAPPSIGTPHWEAAGDSGEFLFSHAIALSSGGVLVLGEGPYSDGFQAPTSGQVWDPSTGTWAPIDDLKHRSDYAAVALSDDRALIVGGLNDADPRQSYSSAYVYDARPGQEGWTKTGLMALARTGPTAVTLPDGRVLVAGGYFHAPEHLGATPDAVLAAYHPVGSDGEGSTDVSLYDVDIGSGGAALATAEVFDPATGQWSPTGPMNYARYGASAVALADGRVLIVGSRAQSEGYSIQVDPRALTTAEIFDPATGRFTLAGELPDIDRAAIDAQAGASRMRMPEGRGEVVIVGSPVALPDGGAVLIGQREWWKHEADLTRSFRFDAASGSWSEIGEAWAYVADHSEGEPFPLVTAGVRNVAGALVAGLPDGRVLVAGGGGDSPDGFGGRHALEIAELCDPATDTWVALPPMPVVRSGGVAATLTDGSIVLAGGFAEYAEEYVLQQNAVRLVP
jgi:N-acetylneuraminic acid mutarotase